MHAHSAAIVAPSSAQRERALVAAWWLVVVGAGALLTIFVRDFLPPKFALDALVMQALLESPDLWSGISFDSYINTARFWSVVFYVVPQAWTSPLFFCGTAAIAVRLLQVTDVPHTRYHVLAGAWMLCSALFLSFPNKEMIALPVALWLCLARSWPARFAAALLCLLYAAFFRQYWVICYFYFVAAQLALRLAIARRGMLALCLMLAAFVLPFLAASAADYEPLTEARMMVNADRVDSPDAQSAFNNTFGNTGVATDIANAALAWPYMNIPLALAAKTSPHYVLFAAFQVLTLWFFVAGCAGFVRDARRIGHTGTTYLRCSAFVIAYSLTQSIFEPDFGSFLRHEVIFMIPMLIVVFYRAHAKRALQSQPMGIGYGRHVSAYL